MGELQYNFGHMLDKINEKRTTEFTALDNMIFNTFNDE